MKALLDRLMARQGRLAAELAQGDDESRRRTKAAAAAPRPVTPQQRESQRLAIERADECLATGDLTGAAEALLPFENEAVDVRVLTILARIQSAAGRFDEALKLLVAAAKVDPTDVKVPYFTAEVLEMSGRYQDAITYRRQVAFRTTSPDPRALIGLMRTVVKAGAATGRLATSELRMGVDALLASPATRPEHILDACQVLYCVDATRAQAVSLYAKHAPCPDGLTDLDARWQPIWRWCQDHNVAFQTLSDAGRPGCRPLAAVLPNVLLDESLQFVPLASAGSVALDGVRSRQLVLRASDPLTPLLMTAPRVCRLRLPEPRAQVEQPCVLVGGSGSHLSDLVEHVGPLAAVEHFGLAQGRRLIVARQPTARMLELLELLGYDERSLLPMPAAGTVLFRDLVVAGALSQGMRWVDPMLPAWYRQRLAGAHPAATRKLYLSRKPSQQRYVVNEDEVERSLVERGFEIVMPEQMTVRELVSLFAQASCIVGASDDALANMVFAPSGTRVVACRNALLGRARAGRLVEALAFACAHAFVGFDCQPVALSSGRRLTDADISVDVPALLAHVDSARAPAASPA